MDVFVLMIHVVQNEIHLHYDVQVVGLVLVEEVVVVIDYHWILLYVFSLLLVFVQRHQLMQQKLSCYCCCYFDHCCYWTLNWMKEVD